MTIFPLSNAMILGSPQHPERYVLEPYQYLPAGKLVCKKDCLTLDWRIEKGEPTPPSHPPEERKKDALTQS
jgi:hypothetical protein